MLSNLKMLAQGETPSDDTHEQCPDIVHNQEKTPTAKASEA